MPEQPVADDTSLPEPPEFELSQSRYRLRFARTGADLEAAQRLRFQVFNLELDEGLQSSYESGRDADQFDIHCYHLLVEDAKAPGGPEVVGTYRMMTAENARRGPGFYTSTEFDLDAFPDGVLDQSVELGRACIHADHRSRSVLFLLWRGLAGTVIWTGKRYLFGCSSLTSRDPGEGLWAYEHLRGLGHVHPEFDVPPLPGFECEGEPSAQLVVLPKLFGTYLRYGGKICGRPAMDREFGTIDFLTINDIGAMDRKTFQLFAPPGMERQG